MSPYLLLGDIQKAFLQISMNSEDRDAFRFMYNLLGNEEHLRFTRIPFGAETSPFILGATLQYHYDQQPEELSDTVQTLRDNTYVDNFMKTGSEIEEISKFKSEATEILESAKFPLYKWESNIIELESENMPNLGKYWVTYGTREKMHKNYKLRKSVRINQSQREQFLAN